MVIDLPAKIFVEGLFHSVGVAASVHGYMVLETIQAVSIGLVSARVDLYLHPLIAAAFIFFAVLIDSLRNAYLAKLGRRNIRVEE